MECFRFGRTFCREENVISMNNVNLHVSIYCASPSNLYAPMLRNAMEHSVHSKANKLLYCESQNILRNMWYALPRKLCIPPPLEAKQKINSREHVKNL